MEDVETIAWGDWGVLMSVQITVIPVELVPLEGAEELVGITDTMGE
jgi:hypothetical protein